MSVMTPERYSQVKSLFQLVLEQPAGGRASFLERACGADRDLFERVRELIKSDSTSEDFLEKPAITPISKLMEEAAADIDEKMPALETLGAADPHDGLQHVDRGRCALRHGGPSRWALPHAGRLPREVMPLASP